MVPRRHAGGPSYVAGVVRAVSPGLFVNDVRACNEPQALAARLPQARDAVQPDKL